MFKRRFRQTRPRPDEHEDRTEIDEPGDDHDTDPPPLGPTYGYDY